MSAPLVDAVPVLVVGEALVDLLQVGDEVQRMPGGSPANVALGLGRLGVPTTLLTHLADDDDGGLIRSRLAQSGVRILPESFSAARTSTATARVDAQGDAEYEFDIAWDVARVPELDAYGAVHAGSYSAFVTPGADRVLELLTRAAGLGLQVSLDPNIRPKLLPPHGPSLAWFETLAEHSGLVKLSDDDAVWLYPDLEPDAVLSRLLELGADLAVLTRGSEGSLLATRRGRAAVPSISVQVVDTVGAGDTYMATLIACCLGLDLTALDAADLERIGAFCARAAGVTVRRAGADLPWRAELD